MIPNNKNIHSEKQTNDTETTRKMKSKTTELSWNIIHSYFKNKELERLVRHQIESFNHFIDCQLKKTIEMFNPVEIHSFLDKEKKNIYNNDEEKPLKITITFNNFKIFRPQIHENNGATKLMYPHEARLRNFTYSSPMTVDINIRITIKSPNGQIENLYRTLPRIHIGKIPIMLKSSICVLQQYNHLNCELTGECNMDPGGYFIINGSEKTVLAQERAKENNITCYNVKKNNNKWSWCAELKSVPDFKCISPKQINIMISTKNNGYGHSIFIQIPRIKQPVSIFILFRALGVTSDEDICKYILLDLNDEYSKKMLFGLKASIIDANDYINEETALNHIISHAMYTPINMTPEKGYEKKREFTVNVLNNDLFPHCRTKTQKIYFLGLMINKLLQTSYGWRKNDDRDSYVNKRIDLVGTLLNNLFRNYFNKLVKDMQKSIMREINNGSWRSTGDYLNIINKTNIYKIVKSTTIENGIKRALATGDFAIKNTNSTKVGVAQVLNRLTYIASLSHLRRINTPIDKSGKLIPPRQLHSTQWGYICPAESPEGQSVGVVKNTSVLSHITIKSDTNIIINVLKDKYITLDNIDQKDLFGKVKLYINGCWIGIVENPSNFYKYLKDKKYKGVFNIYTSIVFDYRNKEIFICNDGGRLTRPIYRVQNNELNMLKYEDMVKNKKFTWDDLLTSEDGNSIIEYIDPEEQNNSLIAMNITNLTNEDEKYHFNYTHCEIHPSTIFGVVASCIPFPEHNQSPRNTYQSAMAKQAIGMYVTNYKNRMDKTAYVQTYTTRPLVDTRLMNMVNLNKIPSGTNVIVAIMTYSGYNQEDSVIFNKSSLDRGLFSITLYHTEKDEDKKIHGDEEIRCKADRSKTMGVKFANYDKLNDKGIVPENTLLENRDIIIGKIVPIKENRNDQTKVIKYTDHSKVFRVNEECYVDKNYIHRNGDGYTFAKIRTRTYRKPNIGDKVSSRHGQKGTVGLILPEADMPTTLAGIKPDIIINPHAIPSRMTIAQLKETILGKVLVELGLFGDGTSFGELSVKEICKELQQVGYERCGNEIMYNGMTGEQLESEIFLGPAFYQRLKHMVNDKYHSRSFGPMVVLTRQPAEGRSRDGGLRFGEMERDCMISHGASAFTKDRIYNASDKFEVHSCKQCGMMAVYNNKKNIHICKTCDNRTDFTKIKIPYACKLLFQELITMNIAPRLITE
jgi:DNA-directed RNA polymerase II subunit RPB2